MKEYYKISLDVLYQLLKEEKIDLWAEWIELDRKAWEEEGTVSHHLGAYVGLGNLSDISLDSSDRRGIWRDRVFEATKKLARDLAKGKIKSPPLEEDYYHASSHDLCGWRCRECGHSRIDSLNTELFIATKFLPKLFVELIQQDKLIEILDTEKMANSEEIVNKRKEIEQLVRDSDITFTTDTKWLWACPECASTEVGAYKWHTADHDTKLVPSKDNVKIKWSARRRSLHTEQKQNWWQKLHVLGFYL